MERPPLGLANPDCTAVELDGRVSLHRPGAGTVHTLNESASSVWRLLDGRRTLDEVVGELVDAYGASFEVVKGEVLTIVADLTHSGLVLQVHESRT